MSFTVRQARVYAGYTQSEISQALGIGILKYRKYENKVPADMEIGLAKKFSEKVGIPIDQIFFSCGQPKVDSGPTTP